METSRIGFMVALAAATALGACNTNTTLSTDSARYRIVPPSEAVPHGHSWDEWQALWWDWFYSMPVEHNAFCDTAPWDTLQHGEGHDGIWFLCGTSTRGNADTARRIDTVRSVAISNSDAVFIPIWNDMTIDVGKYIQADLDSTDASIAHGSPAPPDQLLSIAAEIDGLPIANIQGYYQWTKPIVVVVKDSASWQGTAVFPYPGQHDKYNASSDGYWLMLDGFAVGEHTIHCSYTSTKLQMNMTYKLTVQ